MLNLSPVSPNFFKGRVDAYQLYHEVNLQGMMKGGDSEFIINEIFRDGARAIRKVYQEEPELPVVISIRNITCEGCGAMEGLKGGKGAVAVDDYYNQMIASAEMMEEIDALNMNVSDHFNGYGMMDGQIIPHVWGQYDLVRNKLDARGFTSVKKSYPLNHGSSGMDPVTTTMSMETESRMRKMHMISRSQYLESCLNAD